MNEEPDKSACFKANVKYLKLFRKLKFIKPTSSAFEVEY